MDELRYQVDLLKAMNEKLRSTEEMYRLICDSSSDAFLYCNFSDYSYFMAGAFETFFPYKIEKEADLELIIDDAMPEKRAQLRELLFTRQKTDKQTVLECPMIGKNKWLEFSVMIVEKEDQGASAQIIRIRDISSIKKQREELSYMAYYDPLTGLYNRNYFVRLLQEWIIRAKENMHVISIMCINIDNFKKYNDGFGMLVGDEIIQGLGFFLKDFQKENIIISHTSVDEFYIAIYDPYGTDCVEYIYDKILKFTKEPFYTTTKTKIDYTVSVGVVSYPQAGNNVLELMKDAEVVMLHARKSGNNRIAYYEAPILTDFIEHFSMEDKLKKALEQNQFFLCFQPQYYANTKELRGVEALIRWKDEDGKIVSPDRFIPIAEQNGMIVDIGNWVLEEAFRRYKEWKDKYDISIILSINISALQYKQPYFASKLLEMIEKYDIQAKDVELEITESILIEDLKDVVDKMKLLKECGIKISLDDFGTGYSSLSYLKGLPIDTLKIDKTFIDTVLVDQSSQVIIESIITMVKRLGCETVAEGVETEEQYEYLCSVNCDNIQGFLLGKPMTTDKIDGLLAEKSTIC